MSDTQFVRRILIIDDNEAIHRDFKKTLQSTASTAAVDAQEAAIFGEPTPGTGVIQLRFELESAMQGQEGFAKVEAAVKAGNPFHLAFVDMRMPPGWDGVQTIQALWQADPQLQVVICTAYSDYSWEQVISRLGSTDRLLILKKPFDDVEVCQLAVALTEKWIVTRQANLKLFEMQELVNSRTLELQQAALHDKLTGLPNRAFMNECLARTILEARRDSKRQFALLFLDFDRFKVVNDSLGHEIGDLLLVSIAERLRETMRGHDLISPAAPSERATAVRLGGDEFIVMLDHLNSPLDAARVANRLLETLSKPYTIKGHQVQSTVSIGLTTSAVGYERPEQLIRDADTAMYRAKASGRGRYVVFDPKMHDDAVKRLTLENDLRTAIDGNQLTLHYQPIVQLDTALTSGVEALVRWNHPTRGLIPPGDFIGLAEETGLIIPLGRWVLHEACRQLAVWHETPEFRQLSMSVNVSRKQFVSSDLIKRLGEILSETKLDPSRLNLEITESVIMEDTAKALDALQQIRQMGVRLHMDDFGTGYSSLSCLHRFPIQGLKIDRAFINNVSERRDYAAVVNSIVTLAQNLGIELVAEGVETVDQLSMLQSLGCDKAQGYFFSRPVPPDKVEQFFRTAHRIGAAA